MRKMMGLVLSILLSELLPCMASGQQQPVAATWLRVDIGLIGAASSDILDQSMKQVSREQLSGLLIVLDTPGGALQATRDMVKKILSAPFPTIVWVGPSGAHAGSAGAFITLSGHIAAMAPGTNIGAAHPVMATGQDIGESEVSKKIENDTLAFMESIADLRKRNKSLALSFVENSLSVSSERALEEGVIDLIASSSQDLFHQVHGREIEIAEKGIVKLDTLSVRLISYDKSLRQEILEVLSNPNIFYLLFLAGVIGIGFELTHPGSMFPGVFGAISIILALVATSVLPVNFAGVALIFVSLALLIAEAFVPSFGVLGIGGIVSFVVGSSFLIDSSNELGLRISWYSIVPGAILMAGFGALVAWLVVRAERLKPQSGFDAQIGTKAKAINCFVDGLGQVQLEGEIWKARIENPDEKVQEGQSVTVVKRDGLVLIVKLHS